jgi:hypothetical protein
LTAVRTTRDNHAMPIRRILVSLMIAALAGLLALLAGAAAATDDEKAAAATDAKPARVVIRVDRNTEVMGHVELEEDEVIVVRTLDDELRSFAKNRVVQIIRLVDPEPGQTGVVVLRNGQVREGVIIADDFEQVVVEIEGVRTRFKREVVDFVELQPTFEERYRHFKATIDPNMAQRHFDLCRWLVEQDRYDLAEQELVELLERHNLHEAKELLRLVRAQLALRQDAETPERDGGDQENEPGSTTDGESTLPKKLISREDVNLIRVFEIDFRRPPRLAVSPETVRKLLEDYGEHKAIPAEEKRRERLFRADPVDIVKLMFEVQARDLYSEIEVLSEPHSLNIFRRRVHNTWLIRNCATSRCHGGPEAGRFFLHNRNYRDERVRYTNLLILERLDLDPVWPLVNYAEPTDSLIIQYGLPRHLARKPHPETPGWSPVFRRADDPMIRHTVEWIRSMYRPRVDYPVEYEPPRLEASGSGSASGDDEQNDEGERRSR